MLPGDTGTWDSKESAAGECGADSCARQQHVQGVNIMDRPPSRTAATDSRQLALQLQPAWPPPQTQGAMGPWEPHPHNPTWSLQPRDWGGGGGDEVWGGRDICAFSVQLPDTNCRISELRDQTAAGGSPLPGGLTQARTVCQQIPSAPQPCSSRGLQTAPGQLCWRAERRNQYSQHTHTHSPPLSVNTGPQTLSQPPTHRPPEQSRDGLWDTHSSPLTPSLTTPCTRRQTTPTPWLSHGHAEPHLRAPAAPAHAQVPRPERPRAPAQPPALSPGVRPTQAPARLQQACSQARHRRPLAALPPGSTGHPLPAVPRGTRPRGLPADGHGGARAHPAPRSRAPGPRTPARTLPARPSPAVQLQLQQGLRPLRVAVQAPHGGRGGSRRGRALGTRADTRPPAPGLPAARPARGARPSARRSPPLPAPSPSPRPAEPAPPPARRSARPGRRNVAGAREGPQGAGLWGRGGAGPRGRGEAARRGGPRSQGAGPWGGVRGGARVPGAGPREEGRDPLAGGEGGPALRGRGSRGGARPHEAWR